MATPQMAPAPAGPSSAAVQAAARIHSGANWFLWIAGLSLVNSAVVIFGGSFHFVVGLGVTSVVDVIAKQVGGVGTILAIVINGFVAGVFVLFNRFAMKAQMKAQKWAFAVGMAVYAADGLLLFAAKDILSVAFHAYALYCIYRGMAAVSQWEAAKRAPGTAALAS